MSTPEMLHKSLANVVTLGSFSPETFHIFLGGRPANSVSDLSQDSKKTLSHEFGHLLHYCTSYVGLRDLLHWAIVIDILHHQDKALSEEDRNTQQANEILANARAKQLLSIDDEYYYEPKTHLYEMASTDRNLWRWGETTGALFDISGKPTDLRFWGLRFYLGSSPDKDKSFVRIPVGLRTILEHMAKAIDFFSEYRSSSNFPSIAMHFVDQSFSPELIHYYALTHRVASEVRKAFGQENLIWSFLTTGELVATLSEIPFDDPATWAVIQQYAVEHLSEHSAFMTMPHPSYLFPVVLHAAFNSGLKMQNFLNIDEMESVANTILATIGLPTVVELETNKKMLFEEVTKTLDTSDVGRILVEMLSRLKSYASNVGWVGRFVIPTSWDADHLIVPIVFPNGNFIDGNVLNIDTVEYLAFLTTRRDQMLRYSFTRNIVAATNA